MQMERFEKGVLVEYLSALMVENLATLYTTCAWQRTPKLLRIHILIASSVDVMSPELILKTMANQNRELRTDGGLRSVFYGRYKLRRHRE